MFNRILGIKYFLRLNSSDVVYVCIPLYHSSGSLISLATWTVGGAISMRRKFSAKDFWKDCRNYNATVVIYIGEILRFLTLQPVDPEEANHNVMEFFQKFHFFHFFFHFFHFILFFGNFMKTFSYFLFS